MPRRAGPGGIDPVPPYQPQLARLVKSAPTGEEWLHEMEYDGYRIGCHITDGKVRLIGSDKKDWTTSFPEIATAAAELGVRSALMDGQVAVLLPDGRTSLEALQGASSGGSRKRLVYFVFDLLHVSGETLIPRPLVVRKEELLRLVGRRAGGRIRFSEHVRGRGRETFDEACRLGVGGIISKRADAPYIPGRSEFWVQTKCAPSAKVPVRKAQPPAAPRPLVARVGISHPDRMLFPEIGLTKLQLAQFFERIADWIVPHVKGRPLTLVRCPNGVTGSCFYMKHSKVWAPSGLRRVKIQEKTKVGEYLIADDATALVSLVQMNVLEFHTWNTRYERVELPDRLVFDIDPGDRVTWAQVTAAGKLVRKLLREVGLESFPKTTGGRGLHVVVPVVAAADWKACLDFSRTVAEAIEQYDPSLYTTAFAKSGREHKMLIDYLRNNRTNTSVAAFSTRARAGAPISTPLRWEELKASVTPDAWTVLTIEKRLAKLKADPWEGYWTAKQRLPR